MMSIEVSSPPYIVYLNYWMIIYLLEACWSSQMNQNYGILFRKATQNNVIASPLCGCLLLAAFMDSACLSVPTSICFFDGMKKAKA